MLMIHSGLLLCHCFGRKKRWVKRGFGHIIRAKSNVILVIQNELDGLIVPRSMNISLRNSRSV